MKRELLFATLIVVVVAAIGLALLGWGGLRYLDAESFVDNAVPARGNVVEFDLWEAPGGGIRDNIRYAIVVFTAQDGTEVRFKGPSEEWAADRYVVGQEVDVLYDRADPHDAKINSFLGLWFAPTILLVVGFFFFVVPPFTLYRHVRSSSAQHV